MDNPILRPFRRADLQVKSRARNLFLITVVFTLVMGFLGFQLALQHSPLAAIVAGSVSGLMVFIFLFLYKGWYKFAANYMFVIILLASLSASVFNRTGVLESDLYQAVVFLSVGLGLLTLFGHSFWLTVVQGVLGVGILILITLLPADPVQQVLTVRELNLVANPLGVWIMFGLLALIGVFNLHQSSQMLRGMKNALETIEANNMVLEDMVSDRTQSLRAILDNTGQGFFTFGADFLVEPEYSKGCVDIFKREIHNENVVDLLFPNGGDSAKDFRQGLALFFAGKSKSNVIFDLLEKETYFSGKYIIIDYREVSKQRVLCILTDVTAEKLLEEKNSREEERRTLIFRALNNKHFFASFQEEADRLFSLLETFWIRETTKPEKEDLLRQIHTFKGNAGFFGFSRTQETAHDFEYVLADSLILGDEVPFQDLYFDLKKAYYSELRTISDILGADWLKELGGIVITRSEFNMILSYMKENYPQEDKLIHFLERFSRIPLRDLFSRFPYIAQATAEKTGKRLKPMEFEVEEVRVAPERLGPLAEVCVHLVNNMVDHGIEAPYEREKQGKTSEGQLSLKITLDHGLLQLVFQDDGRGIDLPKVEQLAREKGLLGPGESPTEEDLTKLLFADGFSTKTQVTEISGRGVGLAAVREEVTRLGGKIEVQTRAKVGTTFVLSFPLRRKKE